jgi:lipoyl(octanoyl) transferase
LDQRQRELARSVREGGVLGALLLSEVAPVITLGRRTPASDLLLSEDAYRALGISIERIDRGGLATYHGPGQWVVFAVDTLERLTGDRRGVRKAVHGLLEVALRVGSKITQKYGGRVWVGEGAELGVWLERGGERGKFAAVGVHVERGVLLHGLAINGLRVGPSFLGLKPCGLDSPVAYLLEDSVGAGKAVGGAQAERDELLREASFEALGDEIERTALEVFWPQRQGDSG